MVLYCAALPVALYRIILHKVTFHSAEKAVLFVDKRFYQTSGMEQILHNVEKNKIFHKIVEAQLFIERNLPEKDTIELCNQHFKKIFKEAHYSLDDFEKVYVLNDYWEGDINLYFNLQKKTYTWIQAAKNDLYDHSVKTFPIGFQPLDTQYWSYSAVAPYAKAQLIESSEESKKKLAEKGYSTWNEVQCFEHLQKEDVYKILNCFELDKLEIREFTTWLVLNSYGFMLDEGKWRRFDDTAYQKTAFFEYTDAELVSVLSSRAADYYAPTAKTIYLKTHPHDPINDVDLNRLYGSGWQQILHIPFEFLIKYMQEKQIGGQTIIGYESSSLRVLDQKNFNIAKHTFILEKAYFRTWYFYDSIFVSLLLAKQYGCTSVYASKDITTQMEQLLHTPKLEDVSIQLHVLDYQTIGQLQDAVVVINCLDKDFYMHEILQKAPKSSVLLFLNSDLLNISWEDTWLEGFLPVQLQKRSFKVKEVDLEREECIWVYSKDKQIRKATLRFETTYSLPHSGVEVVVQPSTLTKGVELFKKKQMQCMYQEVDIVKSRLNNLSQVLANINHPEVLQELLRKENNMQRYLELLTVLQSRYLLLVSVKDTPGDKIPEEIMRQMKELGFTKFSKKLWQMYIGIRCQGNVLCNRTGEHCEEMVVHEGDLNQQHFYLSSQAWRKGNVAEIQINQTEYAVNLRGINLVVYDLERKKVVDSIGYDAHTEKPQMLHKIF